MDDKQLERLLHRGFTDHQRPAPDQTFVTSVMQRIESEGMVALHARRPLIVGLAFFLALIVALVCVNGMDWYFLGSLQQILSDLMDNMRNAPPWGWVVLVLPLFWLALVEG